MANGRKPTKGSDRNLETAAWNAATAEERLRSIVELYVRGLLWFEVLDTSVEGRVPRTVKSNPEAWQRVVELVQSGDSLLQNGASLIALLSFLHRNGRRYIVDGSLAPEALRDVKQSLFPDDPRAPESRDIIMVQQLTTLWTAQQGQKLRQKPPVEEEGLTAALPETAGAVA